MASPSKRERSRARMVGKWWVDYAAQSVIHALVAALAVEALLQIWHARAPDDRLALRLLGLGQPLVFTPLLFVLGPSRRGEEFHDRWALFASRRWEELPVLGTTAFHLAVGAAAVLGTLLFLMDLVPLLPGRRRELPPAAPVPLELEAALAEVAAARARRSRCSTARSCGRRSRTSSPTSARGIRPCPGWSWRRGRCSSSTRWRRWWRARSPATPSGAPTRPPGAIGSRWRARS